MAKLIGTDPNQVPTNADLGTMAYQDKGNLSVGTVDTTGDVGINTASGLTDLTIAHYGHGLGLGHEGATLPSLAGLYTSSSTTYGQAYGSLIVKSRTDYAGYSIIFRTQSGEAARFNSAGNLAFPNGQGIDFSATGDGSGTVTSELLDDYEEGTFTPTISSGATGGSYAVQAGRYTKVGTFVSYQFDLEASGKTRDANPLKFGGLPFTSPAAAPYAGGYINYQAQFFSSAGTGDTALHISGGATEVLAYGSNGNAVPGTGVTNINARLIVCGTYHTD